MLCACCSSASSLEIQTWIFSKSVTLWTALQIPLWSKPHLVFRHKVYKIALSEVLTTQMGVTEVQQSARLNCTNLTPFLPHSGSIPRELMNSYGLGCLWAVTICCKTVLSRPAWLELFVDHTHTHSVNSLRWQPHWLSRLTSLPRKSRDWRRTRDNSLSQPIENKID